MKRRIEPGGCPAGERHCWHYIRAAGASQCCRCPATYVRELGGTLIHPGRPRLEREMATNVVLLRQAGWNYRRIADELGTTVGACRAMFSRTTRKQRTEAGVI